METLSHVDIFATKGIEYLIVITYLVLFTGFWTLLKAPAKASQAASEAPGFGARIRGWFHLPDGFHFHQGHTWALLESEGILRVGMDEFARKLMGPPTTLRLPAVGTRLEQGGAGWTVLVDGTPVQMLSPVGGEVLEVNPLVMEAPGQALERPYDDGWLMKVRVNPENCPLRNLLTGKVAQAWIHTCEEKIRALHTGELGVALPDGGVPVDGWARAHSPDEWHDLASKVFHPNPC